MVIVSLCVKSDSEKLEEKIEFCKIKTNSTNIDKYNVMKISSKLIQSNN